MKPSESEKIGRFGKATPRDVRVITAKIEDESQKNPAPVTNFDASRMAAMKSPLLGEHYK